jgi:Glycosyltransferase family 87
MGRGARPAGAVAAPQGGRVRTVATFAFPWLIAGLVSAYVAISATVSSLTIPFLAWDSHAYWAALSAPEPYAGAQVGVIGSFLYPPPFLQLLAPLGRLPWPIFAFGWASILTVVAISLLRRVPQRHRWMLPILVWVAAADIWAGNINLLLAYAIVIAMEHSSAWAVVGLTKLTPVVGALWHVFRREWGAAVMAACLTAGLAALSWVAAPQLWDAWTSQVLLGTPVDGYAKSLPVPLAIRLPAAVALLWWGARSGRPVVVPLACTLALPVIWLNGVATAIGAAALIDVRLRPVTEPLSIGEVRTAVRSLSERAFAPLRSRSG